MSAFLICLSVEIFHLNIRKSIVVVISLSIAVSLYQYDIYVWQFTATVPSFRHSIVVTLVMRFLFWNFSLRYWLHLKVREVLNSLVTFDQLHLLVIGCCFDTVPLFQRYIAPLLEQLRELKYSVYIWTQCFTFLVVTNVLDFLFPAYVSYQSIDSFISFLATWFLWVLEVLLPPFSTCQFIYTVQYLSYQFLQFFTMLLWAVHWPLSFTFLISAPPKPYSHIWMSIHLTLVKVIAYEVYYFLVTP